MELAVLSDMHVPEQAEALPDAFAAHVEAADHVIHAGDFGSVAAYERIDALADGLTAVYGNADPDDIDLPAVAGVELGGVQFVVTHGIVDRVARAVGSTEGAVRDREGWLDAIAGVTRARAAEPRIGIGGHSHEVEDAVHEGVRLLNPGSATDVGRAEGATMLTVEVADGEASVAVREA